MLEFDHSSPSLYTILYTKSCTYIKFLCPRQLYEILSYILVVLKDVTDKLSMFSGAYCYICSVVSRPASRESERCGMQNILKIFRYPAPTEESILPNDFL
jgi:hypothetical protein